jgi:hypothetical protein
MPRGYEEGPVSEAAEARLDAIERGESLEGDVTPDGRRAVFGSTDDDERPHFLGWADEVDADDLFERGEAWALSVRRVTR